MQQQRALAAGADARNLVEGRLRDLLRPLGAVGADGEAVRLVAQSLQEIENGVLRFQAERLAPRQEEALAAGVAVRPLGDADNGDVGHAKFGEYLDRNRELPGAAVD